MNKLPTKKPQTPLENRLRKEASAWARHIQHQPHAVLRKPSLQARRPRGNAIQFVVLAASLLLVAFGVTTWSRSLPTAESESVARQPANVSADDLAALQATNVAIQKVFGAAAENAKKAVDRKLGEVNKLASQSDSLASFSLSSESGSTIRRWALEPGRRYGAAAQWFDSRLGQLGDSSLTAARRLLNRDQPSSSTSAERS